MSDDAIRMFDRLMVRHIIPGVAHVTDDTHPDAGTCCVTPDYCGLCHTLGMSGNNPCIHRQAVKELAT